MGERRRGFGTSVFGGPLGRGFSRSRQTDRFAGGTGGFGVASERVFVAEASPFLALLGLRPKSVTASLTGTSEVMKGDAIITLFLCLFADSGEALPPGAIGNFRSGMHTRAH